jgi:mxaC protein
VLAITAVVVALARPVLPETEVSRIGRGAEIVVLMDRSRSMDERMLPDDWRTIDPLSLRYQAQSRGRPKGQVARDLLARFVAGRPDDRWSLLFFSSRPIRVLSFTPHGDAMQAAIAAGGVGRGLADTDVGAALAAAIAEFDGRPYTGSRVVLLVSDGGARLDDATKRRLRAAAQRNRVALDWIYLRSVNSPRLDATDEGLEGVPEIALHRFFLTLPGAYHAYEAEDADGVARAIADLGRGQSLPLEYRERIPRRELARAALAVALVAIGAWLALRAVSLRSWA